MTKRFKKYTCEENHYKCVDEDIGQRLSMEDMINRLNNQDNLINNLTKKLDKIEDKYGEIIKIKDVENATLKHFITHFGYTIKYEDGGEIVLEQTTDNDVIENLRVGRKDWIQYAHKLSTELIEKEKEIETLKEDNEKMKKDIEELYYLYVVEPSDKYDEEEVTK